MESWILGVGLGGVLLATLLRTRDTSCHSTLYAVGEYTGNCFVRESLKRASQSGESFHCQGRGVHLTDLITFGRYYEL